MGDYPTLINALTQFVTVEGAKRLCIIIWKKAYRTKHITADWCRDNLFAHAFENQRIIDRKLVTADNGINKKVAWYLCSIAWWDARVNKRFYDPSGRQWLKERFDDCLQHAKDFKTEYGEDI